MQIKIEDLYDASHVELTYWIHYFKLYQKNLWQITSDFDKTESGKLSIIGTSSDKMFVQRQNNGYAKEPEYKFYTVEHIQKIEKEINLLNNLIQELKNYDAYKTHKAQTVS